MLEAQNVMLFSHLLPQYCLPGAHCHCDLWRLLQGTWALWAQKGSYGLAWLQRRPSHTDYDNVLYVTTSLYLH